MKTDLTIVTCYEAGTESLMWVWKSSIARHTKQESTPFNVVILVKDDKDEGLLDVMKGCTFPYRIVKVESGISPGNSSRIHGRMLDHFIPDNITTSLFMTMDTDCFPIADGWLEALIQKLEDGAKIVGILHPWSPPPDSVAKNTIEYRVRSQQCWNHTHVACQMIRTSDFRELGLKFNDGDDTGLLIPTRATQKGWKIDGLKPSRCPISKNGIDPEFNRYVSVVYGDCVYHCGGYTRVKKGDNPVMNKDFGWAIEKTIEENGADFLLQNEYAYLYKFDREEEVAKEKLQRCFGLKDKVLGL